MELLSHEGTLTCYGITMLELFKVLLEHKHYQATNQ